MNNFLKNKNNIIIILILLLVASIFYRNFSNRSQTFNYQFEPKKIDVGVKNKKEKSNE